MVIADTDFLSSFVKIKRVALVLEAFNISRITIPGAVLHELEKAPFFDTILALIDSGQLEVRSVEVSVLSEEFGVGELECVSLAKQAGEVLLMSDQLAIKYAEQLGVIVLDVPTFLLYCKKQIILSKKELKEIIRDLKVKDYYDFADEVKRELLE